MMHPPPTRRPFGKQVQMILRRLHLYFGLALFPWAILYGVTAFLFNHPTVLSDQTMRSFGHAELQGTPAETMPTARELATFVVQQLNEHHHPAMPYVLAGEPKFNREFAFATVKQESQTIGLLLDVRWGRGTIRPTPNVETPKSAPAPFAIGVSKPAEPRTPKSSPTPVSDGILFDNPPQARFRAAIPTILERCGFPTHGETVITSVPEVVFSIVADDQTWTATYNPMTGGVAGALPKPAEPLSWRRFFLRLHTAHGYPSEPNARWFWAVIVDVMAFVLCFWGVSGLVMWWQLKATRRSGLVIFLLSAVAATISGIAMHQAM